MEITADPKMEVPRHLLYLDGAVQVAPLLAFRLLVQIFYIVVVNTLHDACTLTIGLFE